jgi:hypothetical protein
MRRGRGARIREGVFVLVGYTALTLLVLRPTPTSLAHTAPAHQGMMADALLYVWAIGHVSRTIFRDPLHLFDAPIYWPAHLTLAHSDHMIGQAVLGFPVWWATGNPLLVFNVLCVASYPFSAACAYAWLRSVGMSRSAAAAGGIAFAFAPFRLHIGEWIQLLVAGFMPLALRSWLRFVAWQRWRDWGLWVLWWVCQGLMGMYLAFYFTVVMGVLGLEAVLLAPARRRVRLVIGTVTAPLVAGLGLGPTLWPYVALRVHQGLVRHDGLDTPLAFLLPAGDTWTGWLLGVHSPLASGPGLVVIGLALIGLLASPQRDGGPPVPRQLVRLFVATGLAVSLLCLLLPTRWLLLVAGFDMLRLTNRALLIALLFVAYFVAEGVDALLPRLGSRGMRRAATLVLLGLLAVDTGRPSETRVRLPLGDELPAVDRWISAHLPPGTPVYELANGMDPEARAMFFSIFDGTRLVNGYSGFTSPAHDYLTQRLFKFPRREALVALDTLGVRWVVARFPSAAAADAMAESLPRPWVTVAVQLGSDAVYEVHGVPPEAPIATDVRPLPRAGLRLHESSPTGTLPLLVDGDPATAWRLWVPYQQGIPSLTIELPRTEPVAGLRVTPVAPRAPGIYFADIEVSEDGQRWVGTDARFRPDDLTRFIADSSAVATWIARFPTRRVRWVRLVNPELAFWGGWWEMAELDVLIDATQEGRPEEPGGP